MKRTQISLERTRLLKAVDAGFGIAPYLREGSEYVDEVRRVDRERARLGAESACG